MSDQLQQQLQAALGAAYKLVRELGGGGMSRVFLAEESALGRRVVVKVLPPEMAAGVSIERFKREIALAARLQHPHIVPLLAAGEMEGVPYFTMPFVEGESLRVRLARHGELPIAEAMRVLREVASALAYAHGRGVVHRDIKPDNVLLSGGSAMVTDFGVAKALSASSNAESSGMTSLGVALGTPAYMSPEQASADPNVDHRADIYAFGVLAYEVLTGQPPFSGRTPQGLLAAHVTEAPESIAKRRGNIPPALGALVMRCLEKRPADRPQSAQDVVHALDDINTPSGGMQPTNAVPAHSGAPAASTDHDWKNTLTSGNMVVPDSRRLFQTVGVVVVLAILAAAGFAYSRRGGTNAASADAIPASVAVLPLVNVGGDTSTQFFADGMTDELTAALAKVPGLRVASRSAVAAVRSTDAKVAGTQLGVAAVLEGRLRRDGNRMALTVQLTNVSDGLSRWSESYRTEVKDAFAVQDSIARSIAGALRIALAPTQQAGVVKVDTRSAKAHDLYLRGRFVQARFDLPSLNKSIELFEEAIREDSSYAAPWSGIADSWGMLADDFLRPRDVIARGIDAAKRGLVIDPNLPELHNSLASKYFWYLHDYPAARKEFETALRTKFDVRAGASYFARLLLTMGESDSALSVIRRLATFDPASPELIGQAASLMGRFGDEREARDICARLRELDPDGCKAWLLEVDGKVEDAAAYARERLKPNPRREGGATTNVVRLLVKLGRMAEARALADSTAAAYKHHYVREDAIAESYGWLGDVPKALEWLERANASQSSGIGGFYSGWERVPIHTDPRFLAFAKRIGLPDPPPGWTTGRISR